MTGESSNTRRIGKAAMVSSECVVSEPNHLRPTSAIDCRNEESELTRATGIFTSLNMLDSEFYSEREIDLVWAKAQRISQTHESLGLRKDVCGAVIRRMEYGNRNSVMGWEICLIVPQAAGGSNLLFNLRPLQWQNFEASCEGALRCVEFGLKT